MLAVECMPPWGLAPGWALGFMGSVQVLRHAAWLWDVHRMAHHCDTRSSCTSLEQLLTVLPAACRSC